MNTASFILNASSFGLMLGLIVFFVNLSNRATQENRAEMKELKQELKQEFNEKHKDLVARVDSLGADHKQLQEEMGRRFDAVDSRLNNIDVRLSVVETRMDEAEKRSAEMKEDNRIRDARFTLQISQLFSFFTGGAASAGQPQHQEEAQRLFQQASLESGAGAEIIAEPS